MDNNNNHNGVTIHPNVFLVCGGATTWAELRGRAIHPNEVRLSEVAKAFAYFCNDRRVIKDDEAKSNKKISMYKCKHCSWRVKFVKRTGATSKNDPWYLDELPPECHDVGCNPVEALTHTEILRNSLDLREYLSLNRRAKRRAIEAFMKTKHIDVSQMTGGPFYKAKNNIVALLEMDKVDVASVVNSGRSDASSAEIAWQLGGGVGGDDENPTVDQNAQQGVLEAIEPPEEQRAPNQVEVLEPRLAAVPESGTTDSFSEQQQNQARTMSNKNSWVYLFGGGAPHDPSCNVIRWIEERHDRYFEARPGSEERRGVVQEIIDSIHQSGGRFQRRQTDGSTISVSSSVASSHLRTRFVDKSVAEVRKAMLARSTASHQIALNQGKEMQQNEPDELQELIDGMDLTSIASGDERTVSSFGSGQKLKQTTGAKNHPPHRQGLQPTARQVMPEQLGGVTNRAEAESGKQSDRRTESSPPADECQKNQGPGDNGPCQQDICTDVMIQGTIGVDETNNGDESFVEGLEDLVSMTSADSKTVSSLAMVEKYLSGGGRIQVQHQQHRSEAAQQRDIVVQQPPAAGEVMLQEQPLNTANPVVDPVSTQQVHTPPAVGEELLKEQLAGAFNPIVESEPTQYAQVVVVAVEAPSKQVVGTNPAVASLHLEAAVPSNRADNPPINHHSKHRRRDQAHPPMSRELASQNQDRAPNDHGQVELLLSLQAWNSIPTQLIWKTLDLFWWKDRLEKKTGGKTGDIIGTFKEEMRVFEQMNELTTLIDRGIDAYDSEILKQIQDFQSFAYVWKGLRDEENSNERRQALQFLVKDMYMRRESDHVVDDTQAAGNNGTLSEEEGNGKRIRSSNTVHSPKPCRQRRRFAEPTGSACCLINLVNQAQFCRWGGETSFLGTVLSMKEQSALSSLTRSRSSSSLPAASIPVLRQLRGGEADVAVANAKHGIVKEHARQDIAVKLNGDDSPSTSHMVAVSVSRHPKCDMSTVSELGQFGGPSGEALLSTVTAAYSIEVDDIKNLLDAVMDQGGKVDDKSVLLKPITFTGQVHHGIQFSRLVSDPRIHQVLSIMDPYPAGNSIMQSKIAEANGIDVVLYAMRHHQQDRKVQADGCFALALLSMGNCVIARKVADANGIDLVVDAMVLHKRHADVQRWGCCALKALAGASYDSAIHSLIVDANGIAAILDAMHEHEQLLDVQRNGCRALDAICFDDPFARCKIADASRIIDMILHTMSQHGQDAHVQRSGCRILAQITFKIHFLEVFSWVRIEQGIDVILNAIRRHEQQIEIQTRGCEFLIWLAGWNPMNQRKIMDADGIEVVLEAMRRHEQEVEVQRNGCFAVASLAAEHPVNQSKIAEANGIEVVLDAMRQHEQQVHVQRSGCFAVAKLAAGHPVNQSQIAATNGIELILRAMRTFKQDKMAQEYGCLALGVLAKDHEVNQQAVMDSGDGVGIIQQVLQRYPDSDILQDIEGDMSSWLARDVA